LLAALPDLIERGREAGGQWNGYHDYAAACRRRRQQVVGLATIPLLRSNQQLLETRQSPAQRRPGSRGIPTRDFITVDEGQGESPLQRRFVALKFAQQNLVVVKLKGIDRSWRLGNLDRFLAGIIAGVFGNERYDAPVSLLHLHHRPGEPFVDGTVHEEKG